jgi:hypothetical protein
LYLKHHIDDNPYLWLVLFCGSSGSSILTGKYAEKEVYINGRSPLENNYWVNNAENT